MTHRSILAIKEPPTTALPDLLIATHEITWLASNYTNYPTAPGKQALENLIRRLSEEAKNVLVNSDSFAYMGTYLLADVVSEKMGHTQFKQLPQNDAGGEALRKNLSTFCNEWSERLRCWLDDGERLTETMQRYQPVIWFLQIWYSLESSGQVPDNRGHPRDLAEAGIVMPVLKRDENLNKWVRTK